MAHKHEVKDKDLRFVLDENLNISNMSELRPLRRGDHNSEILSFTMPRYFEGHDMSSCNVRQVHYDNVYADRYTTKTNSSFDELKDFMIDQDDENKIVFIWQVQGDATEFEGALGFSLLFECTGEAGAVEYRKLTKPFAGLTVGDSVFNTEKAERLYSDVMQAWKEELTKKFETVERKKINLPVDEEGNTLNGTAGQFATSDGAGGITWVTVVDGNEVAY